MNKYELTVVLEPKASSAKRKKVTEVVEKVLSLFSGKITETKEWGVKELAYKLGKNESGFYIFMELEMDAKGVKVLNDKLKNDPEILRFLVIKI